MHATLNIKTSILLNARIYLRRMRNQGTGSPPQRLTLSMFAEEYNVGVALESAHVDLTIYDTRDVERVGES